MEVASGECNEGEGEADEEDVIREDDIEGN